MSLMDPQNQTPRRRISVFRNWISLSGLIVASGSLFAFVLLFVLDVISPVGNPYLGVLAYLIAPGFLVIGLSLIGIGLLIERRQLKKQGPGSVVPLLIADLSRLKDRRNLVLVLSAALIFMLVTAVGSYRSYHFTESVEFCGQACHTVMEPEYTTYLHSPHARVACAQCHVGAGAEYYLKAKINGMHQVYALATHTYQTPIPTPIKNLRPAQETCEQCHWPKKFVGNIDRTYRHYLSDTNNTLYEVRLLLKVGGADPSHGSVGGIHWHMNVGNKVEYVASDPQRQVIPWVRVTDSQGVVTEYKTSNFKPNPKDVVRTMDCMDCHNRPAHIYKAPDDAVDLAISLGRIDPTLRSIKKEAVAVLTKTYPTQKEALQGIATELVAKYPNEPRIRPVVDVVQEIYRNNFFPEMKANWKVYPNDIGHKNWPGCFRCHDGEHVTADGKGSIKANDCNACHTILAQGAGAELEKFNPKGHEFKHPGGDFGDMKCSDCHTGGG